MKLQLDIFYPFSDEVTYFLNKVLAGEKIHHIDMTNSFEVGNIIEFCHTHSDEELSAFFGTPNKNIASNWSKKNTENATQKEVYFPVCCAIEPVQIEIEQIKQVDIDIHNANSQDEEKMTGGINFSIKVGDFFIDENFIEEFALREGFDSVFHMLRYFESELLLEDHKEKMTFNCILVHWTSQLYDCSRATTLAMKKLFDKLDSSDHCSS